MKARIGFLLACCLVIALAFAPAQAAGAMLLVGESNDTHSLKIEIPASAPYDQIWTGIFSHAASLTAVASGDGLVTVVQRNDEILASNTYAFLVCGSSTRDFVHVCQGGFACECTADFPPPDVDPLSVYPKSIYYQYFLFVRLDRNTFTTGSVDLQGTGGSFGTVAYSITDASRLNVSAEPNLSFVPDVEDGLEGIDTRRFFGMYPHWDSLDYGLFCADGGTDCLRTLVDPRFLGACWSDDTYGDAIIFPSSLPGVRELPCGVTVRITLGVLDDFNRASGELGANWTGFSDGWHYLIAGEAGQAWFGGPIYWSSGDAFGTAQEAFVTLTAVGAAQGLDNGLLLKVQSDPVPANPSHDPDWIKGTIGVSYNAADSSVYVATWRPGSEAWNVYASQPLTMADGDVFGARALPNGNIKVYRNGTLVATFTLNAADQAFFNGRGGRIGLWFEQAATAEFDDFGGGTIQAEVSCSVDLVNNTHTCAGIEAVQFVAPPASGQTVMKVNLDRNDSGYTKAVFDVGYGAAPSGWTVNIGDSATNNGFKGDGATQSNDAELDVRDDTFRVWGKDGSPVQALREVPGFAFADATLTFEVSNEKVLYDNHAGTASSLASPYLYALNGQPDSEGR